MLIGRAIWSNDHMFKSLRDTENKNLNHSGRSLIGETLQVEGDVRSSGSVDVAGLINGNCFISEMVVWLHLFIYYAFY